MEGNSYTEQELKECFNLFDKNKDGSMSVDELHLAFRAMNWDLTNRELQEIMKELDTDESGTISYDEFRKLMERKPSDEEIDETLRLSFACFDEDNTGEIPLDKLRVILQNKGEYLTDEEYEAVMKRADVDQSGTINCEEFVRFLRTK